MTSENAPSRLSALLRYLLYGVVTCALVAVPWIAVDELVKRFPALGEAMNWLRGVKLPAPGGWILALLALVVALALVGWVVRRFVWDRLTAMPLFRNFLPSVEQLGDQLRVGEGRRRDVVVWVATPSDSVRTLGLVTGRLAAPTGEEEWLAVVLFPTAGHLRGGPLRAVAPALVSYPGWTVDEALAFVTSSGAVRRAPSERPSTPAEPR